MELLCKPLPHAGFLAANPADRVPKSRNSLFAGKSAGDRARSALHCQPCNPTQEEGDSDSSRKARQQRAFPIWQPVSVLPISRNRGGFPESLWLTPRIFPFSGDFRQRLSFELHSLVREHFALLDAVAHRHAGAIVKTIGDAVMAAFSRPVDAVAAALQMLHEIGRFNHEHGQPAIILKMGAHCGPSIAVTLNENLDYFGQTVNIAARVQSFADAGEICLTEALYTAPGVRELLMARDVEGFEAPLRGVEGNARVYRVTGRS